MAEEIARLVAVMETNLKAFTKGMDQAAEIADKRFGQIEKRMNQTEKAFDSGFKGLSTLAAQFGAAFSIGAVVAFGKHLFDISAALSEQAQIAGVSAERLQAVRNAMIDNGSAAEVADRALAKLNDQLGSAQAGSKSAQDAFKKFGLTAKDLGGDAADVLALVAKRTLEMGSAAEQTAALDDLLGNKLGRFLLPALNDVAIGAQNLTDKYKEQGRVLSNEFTKAMDVAADKMTAAGQKMQVAFAPALLTISEMIAGLVTLATQWEHTEGARQSFMARDTANPFVGDVGKQLHARAMSAGIPLAAPGTHAAPWTDPDATANAKKAADEQKKISDGIFSHYQDVQSKLSDAAFKEYTEFLDRKQAAIDGADQREAEAAQATADEISNIWDDYYQREAETRDQVETDIEQHYREMAERMTDAIYQKNVAVADQVRSAFDLTASSVVQNFDNIGDAAHQLLQQLIAIGVQLTIMKPLTDALFGTQGSGFGGLIGSLGSVLGFAGGGSPPIGRPSLVGEHGPELFVPRQSGDVYPTGTGPAMRIELYVKPSGEFDTRVATESRRQAAQVVVAYDQGLSRRVQQIADDPWRR